MEMSKILQLIDAVNDSELTELSLEEGGEKLTLKRAGEPLGEVSYKNTSGRRRPDSSTRRRTLPDGRRRTRNFPERIWMRREKKQKVNASLLRWWELSILPLPRRMPLM